MQPHLWRITDYWMNAFLANVLSSMLRIRDLKKKKNNHEQTNRMMQHSPCLQGYKTGSQPTRVVRSTDTKTSVNGSYENPGGSLSIALHLSGAHNWNGYLSFYKWRATSEGQTSLEFCLIPQIFYIPSDGWVRKETREGCDVVTAAFDHQGSFLWPEHDSCLEAA